MSPPSLPPNPPNDARAIFVCAEEYKAAQDALINIGDHRCVVPQATCTAFAAELYLKCLLVDAGAPSPPRKHDLSFLFSQLHPHWRAGIQKRWKAFHSRNQDPSLEGDIQTVLSHSADVFEQWRYRFQHDASILNLQATSLLVVVSVLRWFILGLHPDWDDGGTYARSTYPTP